MCRRRQLRGTGLSLLTIMLLVPFWGCQEAKSPKKPSSPAATSGKESVTPPSPAPKAESVAEVKAEPKAEGKPEPEVEPKPEPKVEPKPEAKPEAKPEPKSDPVPNPDPAAKTEAKPWPVRRPSRSKCRWACRSCPSPTTTP